MIGLQVLHLATSVAAAEAGDVLTTMSWQRAHGHRTALAAGGVGDLTGVDFIRYRAQAPAWWLGGKRDLLAQAAAWNPDLIHLHGAAAMPAARAIARRLSLPVVVSIDEILSADQARGLRDATVAWVLVPSEVHRSHFVGRLRLNRDLVCVLPFSIDAVACARTAPRPGDGTLVVGVMTDQVPVCERLLDAVARLRLDEVAVTAVIGWTGAPDGQDALTAAITRVRGERWCSVIPVSQPADVISRCDAIIVPVDTDAPAGVAILGMACGRLVVASAVGALPELIRDGQSGLLVPPQDVAALARAMGRLARDADLRRSLQVSAAAHASQRFDIQVVGPATLELYHAAISARQSLSTSAKAEGNRAYQRRLSDLPPTAHSR
jgi:glycosyltransferase involved in cell wall biosynthesis